MRKFPVALLTLLISILFIGAAPVVRAAGGSAHFYLQVPSAAVTPGSLVQVGEYLDHTEPGGVTVIETNLTVSGGYFVAGTPNRTVFPTVQRNRGGSPYDFIGAIAGGSGGLPPGSYLASTVSYRVGCTPGSLGLQYVSPTVAYDYSGTGVPIPVTTESATLTIAPRAPGSLCLAPGIAGVGAVARSFTIYGEGFNRTTKLSFSDPAVTFVKQKLLNPKTLRVTFNVALDATPGNVTVTVKTKGSVAKTCSSCLSLTPPPSAPVVSPTSVARGSTDVPFNVSVSPTNLKPNSVVLVSGNGITLSPGKITVAPDASTGPRDVTVRNSDGGRGVCFGCLTIT